LASTWLKNPLEKNDRQNGNLPQIGVKKKKVETTTQLVAKTIMSLLVLVAKKTFHVKLGL